MKMFRADGQPSRDDECEHGFRRFEKCPHCLETENERLRDALQQCLHVVQAEIDCCKNDTPAWYKLCFASLDKARAALGEKE